MRDDKKKSTNVDKEVTKRRNGRTKGKEYCRSKSSVTTSKSQNSSDFAGVKTNDPAWYLNNPVLTRDVASIVFSRPTGMPLGHGVAFGSWMNNADPGIMVLRTALTWGGNKLSLASAALLPTAISDPGDPINMTATKLYQYVVHANSRNVSYDKKDLLMTMMAIDSIWQSIAEGIRVYRLIAQYDVTNLFMDKLVTACGWDVNDLRSNVAEFRFFLNYAITRVNRFFVPDLFDMWKLHGSAYTNVYIDEPNSKAQYIIKVPSGYWMYNDAEGDLSYITSYKFFGDADYTDLSHQPNSTKITLNTFRKIINLMIKEVENSQYFGIIQGDLLKAFGYERMAQFAYVDIDVPIYPVYDQEFMFKLHNADISGVLADKTVENLIESGDSAKTIMIYRDTDEVDGNIQLLLTEDLHSNYQDIGAHYIDIPDGIEPTADKVLIMSLYKNGSFNYVSSCKWRLSDTATGSVYIGSPMPEFILALDVFGDPKNLSNFFSYKAPMVASSTATALTCMGQVNLIQKFNTYPMCVVKASGSIIPFWTTDNFAEISSDQIYNINTVILWSLWANSSISAN